MEKYWQLQEAKAKFSELVAKAQQGETQVVTKHGEPAVVVIPYATYQQLKLKEVSAWDVMKQYRDETLTDDEIDNLFSRKPNLKMRPVDF
jgi:prevent-host-death family protein